jgi:hypothetical protein
MINVTPAVVTALKTLEDNSGILSKEAIVTAARNPTSALHAYFDWHDRSAAHKYRLVQCSRLLNAVRIQFPEVMISLGTQPLPPPGNLVNYVRVAPQIYQSIDRARADEDHKRQVMLDEIIRVLRALERAKRISEYFGVSDQITDIETQIRLLHTNIRTGTAFEGDEPTDNGGLH